MQGRLPTFSLRRASEGGGDERTMTLEGEGLDVPVDEDIGRLECCAVGMDVKLPCGEKKCPLTVS